MNKHSETARIRRIPPVCKARARSVRRAAPLVICATLGGALLGGCRGGLSTRTVSLAQLEAAPGVATSAQERVLASDPEALRSLCTPLGPRLGLLQIRTQHDWEQLARAVPSLGRCPNFESEMVIGLACWAGTPVDGQWPVTIDDVRVCEGAGLVLASFRGGTYLPDGTALLETAHVQRFSSVLAVSLNGTRFFP